jgi:GTPase SAR1 family protein
MGTGSSTPSTSSSHKRPRTHKHINKHKIGHLKLDEYQANSFQSLPCKIAIVGPARSGKSSIFQRFLNNSFSTRTSRDTSANVGLRLIEYERSVPIWFEIWDLPTHVPTHGGSEENQHNVNNEYLQMNQMNAWEAHDIPAYNEELRRTHTDPNTGLVEVLKKDHDAVFMVIEATTFASNNLDSTIDALLLDVDFLNDNTQYEILRILVVTKIDELSADELEGILIQVHSIAEDKGIDFVTCSARAGSKSIRDLFKFAAQMTVMSGQRNHKNTKLLDVGIDGTERVDDAKERNNSGATFEDERPDPKTHRAERLRLNRGKLNKTHTLPMDNLYTTMSHF